MTDRELQELETRWTQSRVEENRRREQGDLLADAHNEFEREVFDAMPRCELSVSDIVEAAARYSKILAEIHDVTGKSLLDRVIAISLRPPGNYEDAYRDRFHFIVREFLKSLAASRDGQRREASRLAVKASRTWIIDQPRDEDPLRFVGEFIQSDDGIAIEQAVDFLLLGKPVPGWRGWGDSDEEPLTREVEYHRNDSSSDSTVVVVRHMAGEANEKISAAIAKHHGYDGDSVMDTIPVVQAQLARDLGVSKGAVSKFFNREFNEGDPGGFAKYKIHCASGASSLVIAIRLLRREQTPSILSRSLRDD